MVDETASSTWLFRASSLLTDRFPEGGARLLDALVRASAGSSLLRSHVMASARAAVGRVRSFRRILVVPDLNIGDAVMLQAAVVGLRDYFPAAEIDYAASRLARDLVEGSDEITNVHPALRSTPHPGAGDARGVRWLTTARRYDLVFNFCAFFPDAALVPAGTPVVGFAALAAQLLHATRLRDAPAHVVAQTHALVHELLSPLHTPVRGRPFTGVSITLSDEAAERGAELVGRMRTDGLPLVLVNPDSSSRFTRPPIELQARLLQALLALPCTPVLGAGHTEPGIEARILARLPRAARSRIQVLSASTPIDAYAAVVDAAAVFISGDTGPLHLAAARKTSRSGRIGFRNRTAVLALFGATPARLYGYDSARAGFLAANQEAPSFAHAGASPCRNLTCIHKSAKSCGSVRCFHALDIDAVLGDIRRALGAAWANARARAVAEPA